MPKTLFYRLTQIIRILCVVIVSVYCLMSCNIFYLDMLFLAALKRRSTD